MLDGGGGGGRAGTPWHEYAVPRIWEIVNGQDVDALWQQASGWKKTVELTSIHKYNLQEYKEQLAQAWPPERSEASAAYIAELDKLIASVQETNDAASANYDAVVNLALAVGDAKYKLKPLHDEYISNETKLAEYRRKVEDYNNDNALVRLFESKPESPVPDGRQEELNNKARSIMYSISSEVTTAGAAMAQPKPYVRPGTAPIDSPNSETGGGGGGASTPLLVPPVIPPVTPPPRPPSGMQAVPTPPPTIMPAGTTGLGQGPILGSAGPAVLPPPPPPTPPAVIQPPPPPPPGPLPPIPPAPPPAFGPQPGPPVKPGLLGTGPFYGSGPQTLMGKAGPRPMPPGGVIGSSPGAGLARPGARPMSRVNPPGGMIGGQPGGGLGAGRSGGAVRPGSPVAQGGARTAGRAMGLPASRVAGRRDEDQELQHWDPDNPWETEEGVAPVVLPPDKPRRHDPGPSIGQAR